MALAVYEGCPRDWLNDPEALKGALRAAIAAGEFTHYETVAVRFEPQGVTACAVVGESHLALHTWPEEGRLFFDVASCSTRESAERAVEAIAKALPEGRLAILEDKTLIAE